MTQIRAAIPSRRRIYWIQDGLSANWTPDIRTFAAAHKIELVPTCPACPARPLRQTHPPPRSPSPDRRLMPFPVKRLEKGH
jgi:hypothetical protein